MRNSLKFLMITLLASAAVPASANLVVNGSFETGDFSGWEQINDTSFSGVVEGPFGGADPTDGDFQAFFGPLDPGGGGILQTIDTIAGGAYTLTFDFGNLGPPPNAYGIFWDGAFVDINFDLEAFPYQSVTLDLIASGTSTDLAFVFYQEPSFWLLDNIVLNGAIPEPASWAMMIAGFGLAGAAARRRVSKVTYA